MCLFKVSVLDKLVSQVLANTGTCSVASVVYDSATLWTVALQAPLSMGILQARILEWVAMPSPPKDLPKPEAEPKSPALQILYCLRHQGSPFTALAELDLVE